MLAYIELHRHEDAIAEAEHAVAIGGTRESALLAYALAVAGRKDEARAMLETLEGQSSAYPPPAHIAMVHAALGDMDGALSCLERAYAERDPHFHGFDVRPIYEPIRRDPRFVALVRRMGLTPA